MPALKCEDVDRVLLETLDEPGRVPLQPEIAGHIDRCPHCARIAERQRTLDAALTEGLPPPRLRPSFRAVLYRRLDAPARAVYADALPDLLHLASCAIITAVGASMRPEHAPLIVAAGTVAAVMTHLLLAVMRNTLDESAL